MAKRPHPTDTAAATAPPTPHVAAAVYLHVSALRPNPRNPRMHGAEVVRLARTILRTAWGAPIVAQARSGRIIGGHGRLEAALAILAGIEVDGERRGGPEHFFDPDAPGPAMVPARLVHVSDAEADAMTAADNARALQGTDDATRVLELLAPFGRGTELLADIGYGDAALDGLVQGAGDAVLALGAAPAPDLPAGPAGGEDEPAEEPARPRPADKPRAFVGGYAVAVMCRDEAHQQEVFEALQAAGFADLKVLAL